jgi:hypothetical protein
LEAPAAPGYAQPAVPSPSPQRAPWRRLLALCTLACAFSAQAAALETIELIPEDRASWRARNFFAWIRPGHFYGERSIEVETTPPGATLDLFYVRSNFQKRYEQADAPVRVILPPRVDAGPRDAVTIRAFREGYKQQEVSVRIASGQDRVHIDLVPLPNTLVSVAHTYFAGRSSLSFLTREALTARVQEREQGFNVILAETAKGEDVTASLDGVRSPFISEVESLQLGEDLLVRVDTADTARRQSLELRSRQGRDELRDLYVYSVELVPPDGGSAAVEHTRSALAAVQPSDLGGCARAFDETLRRRLDPAALARALAPRGAFTDPYLRAAMRRLGEVSPGGRIAMLDGSSFSPDNAIELSAAMSQPADAVGYLALLRRLVEDLEPAAFADETLRSLVAPEVAPARFAEMLGAARSAEQSCRQRSASVASVPELPRPS